MDTALTVFVVCVAVIGWFVAPWMAWFLMALYRMDRGPASSVESAKRLWVWFFRVVCAVIATVMLITAFVG